MNKIIFYLLNRKKYLYNISRNNFCTYEGIYNIGIKRFFNSTGKEYVLKNKDIHRTKKRNVWLKKLNLSELPHKKYGNKLGSVAKKLYMDGLYQNVDRNMEKYNKDEYYNDVNKVSVESNIFMSSKKSKISSVNNNTSICNNIELLENKQSCWNNICNELKCHLPFLQPYSITVTLNYLSKINYDEYDIFKFIADNIDERWLKNFNIKDLSLLLLSYSRLHIKYDSFINRISRELLYKISYASVDELSKIAYSYTKMKIYDYEVFLHLCNEIKYKIKNEKDNKFVCESDLDSVNENIEHSNIPIINTTESEKKYKNINNKKKQYNLSCENNPLDLKSYETVHMGIEQEGYIQKFNDNNKTNKYKKKESHHIDNINKENNEISIDYKGDHINVKENKKYSSLCLFLYCIGKMKHRDFKLLDIIAGYLNLQHLNNIDVSNMCYTFSLYNYYYTNDFYKSFCLKSMEIINDIEPLQRVIILTYMLKKPTLDMLHIYVMYLKNIINEMSKNKIYKENLFLNLCINSISCDTFLNFLYGLLHSNENLISKEEEQRYMTYIYIIDNVFIIINHILTYIDFFIKNKNKNISSRDIAKIFNILIKIYNIKNKNLNISKYNNMKAFHDIMSCLDVQIKNTLNIIMNDINKIHLFDLINIKKNLLDFKNNNNPYDEKVETILNSLSLLIK
ncbi:conserved Plasmodium protein, unknown function [Plasmodium sp. gorilla clade G2]|uniref:conserved Plasmodium protein, unknown function n=1 Tax=Plasmodium sp. gorilla clade G2 TaxID=880535 RepID=UPI000D226528|nr:conserved Plasmodium protein, unknown function [Plasmodium sp. gorilla clade G2]SOV16047.1 conserved Plasmodium protein, unknown function [Plasmodium sp. gorilla clade G2]